MVRIGFSTTDKWMSRTIRWFTGAKISHSFILYYSRTFARDMVMDAGDEGWRVVPYDMFTRGNQVIEIVEPKADLEPGLQLAVDWLGTKYDYPGLFGMALVMLFRRLRMRIRNPLHSSKTMFCSEAIVRMLQLVEYPGAGALQSESTTPDDLLTFLKA